MLITYEPQTFFKNVHKAIEVANMCQAAEGSIDDGVDWTYAVVLPMEPNGSAYIEILDENDAVIGAL